MLHGLMLAAAIDAAAPNETPNQTQTRASDSFGRAGSVVLGDIVAARALTPAPIGVVGGTGPLTAGWLSFSSTRSGDHATKTISTEPSFDVFVTKGMSLGGIIGAGVTSFESPNMTTIQQWHFTAMPRIGETIELTKDVAIWARFAAGVTIVDAPMQDKVGVTMRATFDVPFVFRAARHVLLQAGPQISYVDRLSGPPPFRGFSGGASAGLSILL